MSESKQHIGIFLDDSGIFCDGGSQPYFIYAGYVFLSKEERAEAKRKYRSLSDRIRSSIGHVGELKAATLTGKKQHKRALVNVLNEYESMACVIFIPRVRQSIRSNKLSIHRYKDYSLKIAVKRKLETLINSGKIDPSIDTELCIYIDEQHTSTDGFYNLKESIREEFANGI